MYLFFFFCDSTILCKSFQGFTMDPATTETRSFTCSMRLQSDANVYPEHPLGGNASGWELDRKGISETRLLYLGSSLCRQGPSSSLQILTGLKLERTRQTPCNWKAAYTTANNQASYSILCPEASLGNKSLCPSTILAPRCYPTSANRPSAWDCCVSLLRSSR